MSKNLEQFLFCGCQKCHTLTLYLSLILLEFPSEILGEQLILLSVEMLCLCGKTSNVAAISQKKILTTGGIFLGYVAKPATQRVFSKINYLKLYTAIEINYFRVSRS